MFLQKPCLFKNSMLLFSILLGCKRVDRAEQILYEALKNAFTTFISYQA